MNSTERIQATLTGTPVDRRPFFPVLSLYGARLINCPLRQYYSDAVAYAKGQAAARELFEPDALCAPFAYGLIGEAFGSSLHYFADMPPNVRRPAISSLKQWESLAFPDPDTHPNFLFIWDAIARMKAEHGGEIPIVLPTPGPTDLPVLIMGLESWLETVLFDPDEARRVMEKITPFYIRMVNRAFESGAALAAITHAFISPAIVTRDIVTSFSLPLLAEALAQLHGPVMLHHIGAPLLAHLDLLTGLPSVVGFIMDQRDDLAKARTIVGSEATLFSGVNAPGLPEMSATEVENICRGMLENQRDEMRFMLGNTGPDVPWDTPPENIHAMRKATEAFGGTGL